MILLIILTISLIEKSSSTSCTFNNDFLIDYVLNDSSISSVIITDNYSNKTKLIDLIQRLSSNNIRVGQFKLSNTGYVNEIKCNHRTCFLLDLEEANSFEYCRLANEQKLFRASCKWLLLNRHSSFSETSSLFSGFNLNVDSDIVLASFLDDGLFNLSEIYKINSGQNFVNVRLINTWKLGDGFLNNERRILSRNRRDLNGTVLKACIVSLRNDTLKHLEDYRNPHIEPYTKVNYLLTHYVIDSVNGSKEFIFVNDWGYKIRNTSFYTGMIGILQRHDAEIGGTGLYLTKDRVPVIEYLPVTIPTRSKFVFRQPPLSYVANIFTLPFSNLVWICSIGLVVLVSILIYMAVCLEIRQMNLNQTDNMLSGSIVEIFMLTIAAVSQQGATNEPRSTGGKIIMIITFFVLMFLYVSYSANIVALLQSSSSNIITLEDLLKSRLTLGVDDTVYNHFYFETAKEPIRQAIYKQKVAPKGQTANFMSLDEGVTKVKFGFFAFYMELGAGYKLVNDKFSEYEKCGLQEIEFLQVVDPHTAIRKNSVYKEILKIGYLKIHEFGLRSREFQKLYSKRPKCSSTGGNFVSVGMTDSYRAFFLIIFGIILAIVLFIVENIYYKYQKK